jgi:hypothetical protein
MLNIGFYLPHLDIQGTGVSSYDYAYYNEKILGNKSYFFYDEGHQWSHPLAIEKFKNNLTTIALVKTESMSSKMKELEEYCKLLHIDAIYIQKLGFIKNEAFVENIPNFIHCVGLYNEKHGQSYAYVSEWLSEHCSQGKHPWIPYMVSLPDTHEDLRKDLKIPQDAIVFGRTGGPYSWNIPFVNDVICKILMEYPNVYFLFANTPKFINHDRVIFHDPFSDLLYKRKFINTCDAFLHARFEGESFGASVAEFSTCNKPVITYKNSRERNHIFVLKDIGFYYTNKEDLYQLLKDFIKDLPTIKKRDLNAYKDFTPKKVMQKFKKVFIDSLD